jgi:hypothetical protein
VDESLEDGEGVILKTSKSNLFEPFLIFDLSVYRNSNMLYVMNYFIVFFICLLKKCNNYKSISLTILTRIWA